MAICFVAEKVDAISDAMETYAQQCAVEFLEWTLINGWQKLEDIWEYSNGERHLTGNELYELFKCI